MASIFGLVLTNTCSVFLTLTLFTLAAFFRSLPAVFKFLGDVVYMFLRISYQAYKFLLTTIFRLLESEPPGGIGRVIITTLLSLLIFNGMYFLIKFSISGWVSGFAFVHGLSVGLFWDDFDDPDGLNLGVSL
jgi:hypothetical protein